MCNVCVDLCCVGAACFDSCCVALLCFTCVNFVLFVVLCFVLILQLLGVALLRLDIYLTIQSFPSTFDKQDNQKPMFFKLRIRVWEA